MSLIQWVVFGVIVICLGVLWRFLSIGLATYLPIVDRLKEVPMKVWVEATDEELNGNHPRMITWHIRIRNLMPDVRVCWAIQEKKAYFFKLPIDTKS